MKVGGEIVEGEGWLVGVFEVEVGFRCLVVMCLGEGGGSLEPSVAEVSRDRGFVMVVSGKTGWLAGRVKCLLGMLGG